MTEQDIRNIIRQELQFILKTDRFTFEKHIQILDARNIQVGKTNGTKIGTDNTQKIAFYGETPVAQHAAIGSPVPADVTYLKNAVDAIIDALNKIGIIA